MITVLPHEERWRAAVRALNERVRPAGGVGFFEDPSPAWLPRRQDARTFREYFVAMENGEIARGGYVLKHEKAWSPAGLTSVACVQGPYSEGAVDPRQAHVVFALIRDMIARQPLLYGWGLERRISTIGKLFGLSGWRSHETPFLIWAGLPGVARGRSRGAAVAEPCEDAGVFDACANELWTRTADRYAFVISRDAGTLRAQWPCGASTGHRLLISQSSRLLGWAFVGVRGARARGPLSVARAGVVWDVFGAPEDAEAIVTAAHRYLIRSGAAVILASASHSAWIRAFRLRRFRPARRSRHLLVSSALADLLCPFEQRAAECFLTFADGEGPLARLGRVMFGASSSSQCDIAVR